MSPTIRKLSPIRVNFYLMKLCLCISLLAASEIQPLYPQNLRSISVNNTALSFAWDKPGLNQSVTGYKYKFIAGRHEKVGEILGVDNAQVTFTCLSRKQSFFTLSVAFMYNDRMGPYSPQVYAKNVHKRTYLRLICCISVKGE